ncbi:MAG TPA: efflux RND transporter periplasmic adaptor subunit [Kofleriaceae bacterium]|nr:efflux RND transporter periplasmic adaptor subunit [Kofleriaceae bacterium]
MKSNQKRWLGIGVAIAAAGAGIIGFRTLRGGGEEAVSYATAPVTRGRIASQVTATGTLSPLVTVQVGSQVSGRIQELHADFNSEVKKGQVIAKIDPQIFQAEVARARANLTAASASVARAQAEARDAKQTWERTSSLASRGIVASAEADSARASYDAASAQVSAARAALSQARAAVEQAETNLAYTTIVSPIDGVVISRDVVVGQTVAASLQAPTLFTIAEDLAKMEVHTSVAESDVGSLAPGMPVEFTVDAYPSERFRGTVKQVRYSPTTVSNVVTYDAVVAVDNPELKLRPGMTADVTFLTEEREDALSVPNAALRFRPPPEVLAELGLSADDVGPGMRGGRGRGGPDRAGGERPAGEGPGGERPAGDQSAGGERPAGEGPGGERPAGDQSAGEPAAADRGAAPAAEGPGGAHPATASGEGPAGRASGRGGPRNRRVVWKLGPDGKPVPVRVRIGISDGRVTEITGGELAEGDQIITGLAGEAGAAAAGGPQQQQRGGARRRRGFL